MHFPLDPSSRAPSRGPRVSPSVSPVYESEGRRVVRAGVLAIANGLLAPSSFWELLHELAVRAEWLPAALALASRLTCHGGARSDGRSPRAGSCGTWQSTPRLTSSVTGSNIASDETLESDLTACFSRAFVRRDDDPFPHRQPGDPRLLRFWERAC